MKINLFESLELMLLSTSAESGRATFLRSRNNQRDPNLLCDSAGALPSREDLSAV